MAPSFEVREVRNGLFRIYWITDDSFDRYNSKTFQLCGSQSGRTFEISCKFEKCLASFNVREVSFSENSVSESTKSSEGNSGIQQPKRQKLGLNVLETEVDSCPPHHMWINYKNNTLDEKILYLKSSGIWSFSSTNGTGILFPDAITLSMDFGNISNGLAKLFRSQQHCVTSNSTSSADSRLVPTLQFYLLEVLSSLSCSHWDSWNRKRERWPSTMSKSTSSGICSSICIRGVVLN